MGVALSTCTTSTGPIEHCRSHHPSHDGIDRVGSRRTSCSPSRSSRWCSSRIRLGGVIVFSHPTRCQSRRGVLTEIRRLTVQMAEENPTWGYTRIQGALRNVGHRVGRSTIARILKAAGVPPQPQRPTSWQTFLRAHWGVIAGADFFTTEVWTWRGLVTYYTVFVIDLASRRAHILGSTPHPHEWFMRQVGRTLTTADDGILRAHRVLICDRDAKWSGEVRRLLGDGGIRVVQTPWRAPNANAHAERFVRSIKQECLDRLILLGERHFRQTVSEYGAHYHHERNHQGWAIR